MPSRAKPDGLTSDEIRSLLSGIKAGDSKCFEKIFTAYYNRLYAFSIDHNLDGDTASDIVQQVMITFWQRRSEWLLPTASALAGYLFKATRNLINKRYRDTVNRDRLLSEELSLTSIPALSSSPINPHEISSLRELEEDIDKIISAMPTDRRVAITLRLYDSLEYEQIAEIMGISVTAARMHLSRARAGLAPILEKYRS